MVSYAEPFWWRIVVSEETAVVQVTEVLLMAPVIHVILRRVQCFVLRWSESRPWLPQVIANGNRRLQGMGVRTPRPFGCGPISGPSPSHIAWGCCCVFPRSPVAGGCLLRSQPSWAATAPSSSVHGSSATSRFGFIADSSCRTVAWSSRLPCSGSSSSTTPWAWALPSP